MLQKTAAPSAASSSRQEWAEGGRTVFAAATGLGVGVTLFAMTSGMFIMPLQEEFGLTRAGASIAPIAGLGAALLAPIAGFAIDRLGSRPMAIAGLVLLAVAYLMLAYMPVHIAALYGIVAFIALIGTLSSTVVYAKGVATWFVRSPGLAFALMMTGISVAAALSFPLLAAAMKNFGWRSGYLVLAGLIVVAGLPAVLMWFRERQANGVAGESAEGVDGLSLKQAIKDKRYWICMTAFAAASFGIGGFLSQMQPMFIGFGLTATKAAAAGSVFALGIGLGRIVAGILLDRYPPNIVAAAFLFLPVIGIFLLMSLGAMPAMTVVVIAAFLIGCGQGAEGDFIAFFTLRLFGVKHFAVIFSTVGLTVSIGMALGGLLFADLYDRHANYDLAILIGGALFALAACCILAVRLSPSNPQKTQ